MFKMTLVDVFSFSVSVAGKQTPGWGRTNKHLEMFIYVNVKFSLIRVLSVFMAFSVSCSYNTIAKRGCRVSCSGSNCELYQKGKFLILKAEKMSVF